MTRPLARPIQIPGTCCCGLRGQHHDLRECIDWLHQQGERLMLVEAMHEELPDFVVASLRRRARRNERTVRAEIIAALMHWTTCRCGRGKGRMR